MRELIISTIVFCYSSLAVAGDIEKLLKCTTKELLKSEFEISGKIGKDFTRQVDTTYENGIYYLAYQRQVQLSTASEINYWVKYYFTKGKCSWIVIYLPFEQLEEIKALLNKLYFKEDGMNWSDNKKHSITLTPAGNYCVIRYSFHIEIE